MTMVSRRIKNVVSLCIAVAAGSGAGLFTFVSQAAAIDQPSAEAAVPNEPPGNAGSVTLDRSGQKRVGKASFYASRYSGKTMADGTPMKLYSNNAASLTLPLGTTARVTNLETGKSAIVVIRDRGPYVKGRIVDLSPATANAIGISKRQGLAEVAVTPTSLPEPKGAMRLASLNNR